MVNSYSSSNRIRAGARSLCALNEKNNGRGVKNRGRFLTVRTVRRIAGRFFCFTGPFRLHHRQELRGEYDEYEREFAERFERISGNAHAGQAEPDANRDQTVAQLQPPAAEPERNPPAFN